MKRKIILVLAGVMLLTSAYLMFYPLISNRYIERTQEKVYAQYNEAVKNTASSDILMEFEKAEEYNKAFIPGVSNYSAVELEKFAEKYESLLNIDNNGIMGYVEIPKLDVSLPIYHGTNSSTLELGCGHLLGSSLPIGGSSTHSIITAHSGLASQKMFSDIDLLEENDFIQIEVLGKKLSYEVIEKNIVLPAETENIEIVEDQDLISLVTCTPFGVNTHRLVITAQRVENSVNVLGPSSITTIKSGETSIWEQEYIKGIALGLLALCGLCTGILLPIRHFKRK